MPIYSYLESVRSLVLNCFSISQVKIKISSKSVGPVVLLKLPSSSIDKSNGSKSNKKSEDYVFLHTLSYGVGQGTEKWNDPCFKLMHISKKSGR